MEHLHSMGKGMKETAGLQSEGDRIEPHASRPCIFSRNDTQRPFDMFIGLGGRKHGASLRWGLGILNGQDELE